MEEKNLSSNKQNRGLIALLVVLIIIIIAMGCFIAYDKGLIFSNDTDKKETGTNVNNNNQDQNITIEEKEIALNDSRFLPIYEELKEYTYKNNRENGYSSFTEYELATIAYTNLQQADFTATSEKTHYGDPYYTFKGNTALNYLKKYFGNNVSLNNNIMIGKSITINVNFNGSGMTIVSYDNNTDTFKVKFAGVGGTGPGSPNIIDRKITSAKIKNDVITVEEKAIYTKATYNANHNEVVYSVYADPTMSKVLDSQLLFDVNTINNQSINIDKYINSASTITHTYKLDQNTGNYYFVSSVIK